MRGDEPLGLGEGTTALEELADLEGLEGSLAQDYNGASLADVDEEAVRRALGRQAVDDLDQLRRVERELEAQGYLTRRDGRARADGEGGTPARSHGAAEGVRLPPGGHARRP